MVKHITVAEGYNGSTVELDAQDILAKDAQGVKLHVLGKPWLIRWVPMQEYIAKTGL